MEADRDSAGALLARYYDLDLEPETDDVDFYLALTARGKLEVLELGCGSGRLAIPIAQAGNSVVGVDKDTSMLARARTKWAATSGPVGGSLELIQADLLSFHDDRRFDLVILALNMLPGLPGRQAQALALAGAAQHTKRGGHVVLDASLPSPADVAGWDGTLSLAWQRTDPDTGDIVAKAWSTDYDHVNQVASVTTYFDSWPTPGGPLSRVARRDELHLLTANELRLLVEKAGLAIDQAGGDYAMSPLDVGSERAVLVCSLL
jgi:SAM-dependent methyltransferase